jgi:hypothetical protein
MICPECQLENPDNKKFCRECGAKLLPTCPQCKVEIQPDDKFCGDCGYDLAKSDESAPQVTEPAPADDTSPPKPIASERKHVTALFSDLSGYTAMSERLDPEEVKEITGKIFDEVSKIVRQI